MLANKKKYKEDEIVTLSTNCSCVIKKDISILEKLQDLESCTVPCYIEKLQFTKALCDLGSGVSLMPLSIAKLFGMLLNMKPTPVTL